MTTNDTTAQFKTYARAIDARAFIDARPELAVIPHEIVTVDGRAMPVFTVSSYAQQAAIDAAVDAMPIKKRMPFKVNTGPALGEKKPFTTLEDENMPEAKTMDQKAMLANLTVKGWSGRASDKEAADYVATGHQANVEWVRVSKMLVKAEALKEIRKVENKARATHRELTLPWQENGQRILPAAAAQEYLTRMGTHSAAHEAAVDRFMQEYDNLRDGARAKLGGLFDANNYPESHDLMSKFVFDSELSALDITGDFRVEMSDADMKRLQKQITKRTETRVAAAMTDVYQRLAHVVGHMAQRLKDYQPKTDDNDKVKNPFRDATLRNVEDMVDLLPKLNLTNDPALDKLAAAIRDDLLAADAATLRSDDKTRASVAEKAEKIVASMAGMM